MAIYMSQQETWRLGAKQVEPAHILLGLLKCEGSAADRILTQLGASRERLYCRMELRAPRGSQKVGSELGLSKTGRETINASHVEAHLLKHIHIGSEHLLLGLMKESGLAGQLLRAEGLKLDEVRKLAVTVTQQEAS